MGQQRQSGIELLRLLAMFGIVLSHWGGHGSWELTPDNTNLINKVFIQLTQYFGEGRQLHICDDYGVLFSLS